MFIPLVSFTESADVDRYRHLSATHVIPEGEGVKADLLDYGITKKPLRVLGYVMYAIDKRNL